MTASGTAESSLAVVERLLAATNAGDLDGLVDCFCADYRNDTPAHPDRGFRGREQVRRNWTQIFAGVPDLRADVLRSAVDGATVWTEWHMSGTKRDGTNHVMCGVIIFGIQDGQVSWARFFLEPVSSDGDIDKTVRRQVGAP